MNTLKKIYLFVLFFCPLFLLAQRSTVIISELMYDTPLPEAMGDTFAHDGEFVSLYNYGNETVDVSGWDLQCEFPAYTIPVGTKILPGGILVIAYRSQGSNFDISSFYSQDHSNDVPYPHHVLYQRSVILPNNVSTIALRDANGRMQDYITYDGIVYNGEKPNREGYLSISLQRKNIHIDPNTGLHLFLTDDYGTGRVLLFSFNANSSLKYTYEDGHQITIESFDRRDTTDITGGSLGKPLPGSLSVSATGGASYTVPIEIPQGVRGMHPKLALAYNSQSGMGVAGLGFDLQGLSAITRTGKNLFYDGERTNDFSKFMLDGQRLKTLNVQEYPLDTVIGERGGEGGFALGSIVRDNFTVYETAETPSLNDIRRYHEEDMFVIKTREGITLFYGDSKNSSLPNPADTTQKLSYLLRGVTDGYGNEVRYTYLHVDNKSYIEKINYGSSGSNTGTEIKFIYEHNPLKRKIYNNTADSLLLSKIEIYSNGELLYYYKLEYESSAEKAYIILKTIRKLHEGSAFGPREELPLSFLWSAANNNSGNLTTSYCPCGFGMDPDDDLHEYIIGDIDGNGEDDIVRFGSNQVDVCRLGKEKLVYDNDFTANQGWTSNHRRWIVDINGDGSGDLVGQGDGGIIVSYSNGFIPSDRARTKNDQFGASSMIIPDFGVGNNSTWSNTDKCPVLFGDINGDGFTDVVGIDDISCRVYLNNNGVFEYFGSKPYITAFLEDEVVFRYELFDIDLDGKDELVRITGNLRESLHPGLYLEYIRIDAYYDLDNCSVCARLMNSIYFLHTTTVGEGVRNLGTVDDHLFGDLNNDGFLDMVAMNRNSLDVHYFRNGVFSSESDFSINEFSLIKGYGNLHRNPVSLGDINGDGLLDIIGFAGFDVVPNSKLLVLLNTGNGFVRKEWGTWNNDNTPNKALKTLCDLNGDGISDICVANSADQIYISSNWGNKDFRQLTGISDGSGLTTTITYDIYKKTESDIYSRPFREISAFDVVTGVKTTTSDNATVLQQTYTYNRAIFDTRRGDLLGFLSGTITDVINNASITKVLSLDTARSMLYPLSTTSYLHDGNTKKTLNAESYSYSIKELAYPYGNKKYLSKKRSKNIDKNIVIETKYSINDYGNPTSEVSSVVVPSSSSGLLSSGFEGGTVLNEKIESKDSIQYLNYQSYGLVKRPSLKIQSSGYIGRLLTDTIFYTYNEHGDVLTETTTEGTTTYTYYTFGMPEEVMFIPADNPDSSVTTYYDYSWDNRFLRSTSDENANMTTKEYDLKHSRLISETDIFDKTKTYVYDNFGRVKSTTDEDGVKTTFTESNNGRTIHVKNITMNSAEK